MKDNTIVTSKIFCASPADKVFQLLNSNAGRRSFWAESAEEIDGIIHFVFPNGQSYKAHVLRKNPDVEYALDYFNSTVTFHLDPRPRGGTIVTVINTNISSAEYAEIRAGWVSVLMALKAQADFGVDLRNHHNERHWDTGFVDN